MLERANGKINLALKIVGKRDDGYHNLDMVMLPIELHDTLEITPIAKEQGTYITCDDADIKIDESNLVYKAYRVMKDEYHFKDSFRIHIHKVIPIGGGLAGGSADAAAMIRGLMKILKLEISYEKLIELSNKIGSDVPFCLFNFSSRVKERGEQLLPIYVKNKYYVLLVLPETGLSTQKVFDQFDISTKEDVSIDDVVTALAEDNDELLKLHLKNNLLPPAKQILPEIGSIIKIIKEECGQELVSMTGSGSTVFCLNKNKKALKKTAKYLKKKYHYNFILTSTIVEGK